MKLVVFRADASLAIGTGHVMRCLTLAGELTERGMQCEFVTRAHPGHLIELIRARGFCVHVLEHDAASAALVDNEDSNLPEHWRWLGVDWWKDAQATLAVLDMRRADYLVVDHYALDARFERAVRARCDRLLVIDDLADRQHDCDMLVDQNLGRSSADYTGLVPRGCDVHAGPRYALLRPEFVRLRPESLSRRAEFRLQRILVSLGGVDQNDATSRVLEALENASLPAGCRVTVVMGPHAPWLDNVRRIAARLPTADVLVNVQHLGELMTESDLAIGAAGSTSWERCTLGLPSVVVVLADNQRVAARALHRTGAARMVGLETLSRELTEFFEKPDLMKELMHQSNAARQVCDGRGASRVANLMLSEALE